MLVKDIIGAYCMNITKILSVIIQILSVYFLCFENGQFVIRLSLSQCWKIVILDEQYLFKLRIGVSVAINVFPIVC